MSNPSAFRTNTGPAAPGARPGQHPTRGNGQRPIQRPVPQSRWFPYIEPVNVAAFALVFVALGGLVWAALLAAGFGSFYEDMTLAAICFGTPAAASTLLCLKALSRDRVAVRGLPILRAASAAKMRKAPLDGPGHTGQPDRRIKIDL